MSLTSLSLATTLDYMESESAHRIRPTSVRLSERELEMLREFADLNGLSISSTIRMIILRHLREEAKKEKSR